MNREVLRNKQRLDHIFSTIEKFAAQRPIEDILLSHLSKYLCIIVCGFLETSVREIYSEYAQKKAGVNIANFVSNHLAHFQNPNMEKILQIIGAFNSTWREEMEKKIEGDIKGSIDSLASNRNIIAHGGSVGITIIRVKRFYAKSIKLLYLIEAQCNS